MNTNPAGSKKRKASEDNTMPNALAPKKGKATITTSQMPAQTFLAKNFKTSMPAASPISRLTQSQLPKPPTASSKPPAASSSALPLPSAASKSRSKSRKAAALRAASTQATNKGARKVAAQARSKERAQPSQGAALPLQPVDEALWGSGSNAPEALERTKSAVTADGQLPAVLVNPNGNVVGHWDYVNGAWDGMVGKQWECHVIHLPNIVP
ncbi:hypothetical protein RhiXN_07107 [Rhizoctonia solani]|uniref:Uncharacterized protein n=1 Tax=Rhizoctonia solani TaxID=456999 RepID=A0A8H8P5N9_9AGAM|nr:uncharacterized protein RhiXN_10425 [Rhizoctonia solani]XP_043185395.1 uncharacterized protein RhiXN_07107 [Rhizoctonia solani]QRW24101.1 hypothetical protein RhiXN_10425 [Rhizoctonia solani]QRW25158.1 hypothetical protein RhiXN_07107 [Rhizoctonia solani]